MLCSRSASLTSRTRMSSDKASRNLRRFSAARSFSDLRLDLAELGDAVDQPSDIGAEQFLDLLRRGDRILDGVVEDGGDDGLVVQLQVGEDAGNLDRMAEIGVAGGADLGAMRLHREDIGAVDQPLVGIRIVGPDLLDQLILPQHDLYVGSVRSMLQVRSQGMPRAARQGAGESRAGKAGNWLPRAPCRRALAGAAALHLASSARRRRPGR